MVNNSVRYRKLKHEFNVGNFSCRIVAIAGSSSFLCNQFKNPSLYYIVYCTKKHKDLYRFLYSEVYLIHFGNRTMDLNTEKNLPYSIIMSEVI
jgi:hypothetical protein